MTSTIGLKCLFTLVLLLTTFNANSQSLMSGLDEKLINIIPVDQFDFAGSWTAYVHNVEYNRESAEVSTFEIIDTVELLVFNRLIGFPTKAYSLASFVEQQYWDNLVFNLSEDSENYTAHWLGKDELKAAATATTYGERAIQFNIDITDQNETLDDNLFFELVRDKP